MNKETRIAMAKVRNVAGSLVVSVPAELATMAGMVGGDMVVVKVVDDGRILLVAAALVEDLVK
jgi:antitoxin component of MazEF toxin-antitoxin module